MIERDDQTIEGITQIITTTIVRLITTNTIVATITTMITIDITMERVGEIGTTTMIEKEAISNDA